MVFVLFLLFYFVHYSTSITNLEEQYTKISNDSTVLISLKESNTNNPNENYLESMYTLQLNISTEIIITDISPDVHFVVLQVHTFLKPVTLSYDPMPTNNNSIQNTNVGLVKINNKGDMRFYLFYESSEEADAMVVVQSYGSNFPIPGGCNMEFPVETSPFLLATFNDAVVSVDFAPAAPPLSVLPLFLARSKNECNIKPSPVHHEMYHLYLPERDFTSGTYFRVLRSLMTKDKILKNGALAKEKPTSSPMRRIFASYPGTGNAFVVVATFQDQSAVYVPTITYSCPDISDSKTCGILSTTFYKICCACAVIVGLLLCIFGHFGFYMETFFLLFLASEIVSYIIFSSLFNATIAFSVATGLSFFVAVAMLSCFKVPIVSFCLATLTFGFFLASIIMNPIVDSVDILVSDINHWGIFIGILLACPFLMGYLAHKANIISCAFLGACLTTMSLDYYVGSNLRFIILNTIRRATADKFNIAIIDQVFQWKDCLLCIFLIFLTIIGIIVQMRLTIFSAPYPVGSKVLFTETTPLLGSTIPQRSSASNILNIPNLPIRKKKYRKRVKRTLIYHSL